MKTWYTNKYFKTPEPLIPPEDYLLDPDFSEIQSFYSMRSIIYLSEQEGMKENICYYIPFELEDEQDLKVESNINRNLGLSKSPVHSIHDFNSEDYPFGFNQDGFHL